MIPFALDEVILAALEQRASDVHFTCGCPVFFRIDGEVVPQNMSILRESEELIRLFTSVVGEKNAPKLQIPQNCDCAFEFCSGEVTIRCRLNFYWSLGNPAASVRLIPSEVPTLDSLGLPSQLKSMCRLNKGIFLSVGPSGSGKSTTLAGMIHYINTTRRVHVVTLEDPVEYIHMSDRSLIHQREIGSDCPSFPEGLRQALRQDPDVVVIGEMRDPETISAAVTAAETGHLVLGTLHTQDAAQTVDRIIDAFPPFQQSQVRLQISGALAGICSQQLVPAVSGGRVAAAEFLTGTLAVKNAIREGKTAQIKSLLQTGASEGMRTMEQSLASFVREGRISEQAAFDSAFDPSELRRLLSSASRRSL